MVVPRGCPSWLPLMVVPHGCPSWLPIMVDPHGCPSWLSLKVVTHGCPSWLSLMAVPHGCPSCISAYPAGGGVGCGWLVDHGPPENIDEISYAWDDFIVNSTADTILNVSSLHQDPSTQEPNIEREREI
jgi:hypothetical protein